jgi:RNA polymerase sigma-70 factor (ECF subfamily)
MSSPSSSKPPSELSSNLYRFGNQATPEWWLRFATLYAPVVRRWALRAGLPPADADDLLQQVRLAVCRGIATFQRNPGSFTAWVYTITRRQIIDFYRERGRLPEAVGGTDFLQRLQQEPAPTEDAPTEPPPEALSPLVRRAMDLVRTEFETRTWEAFRLVVMEQRETGDVAATLGMSPATVRQAKSRVLRRLRAVLDPREPGRPSQTGEIPVTPPRSS